MNHDASAMDLNPPLASGPHRAALIVGTVAGLLALVGAFLQPRDFFPAYLYAYVFWIGLTLGCFTTAMIHHLTGGAWGFVTRRFLEAGFMTLPLMVLLFVPLCFGLPDLYPWARPEAGHNPAMEARRLYQTIPFFIGRAIFCFAIWILIAFLLRRWSLAQDRSPDLAPTRRLRILSGPGMVIYPLTGTFAFVDWVMSTEPHWYSTMFAIIVLSGQVLMAIALAILCLAYFRTTPPLSAVVTESHFHHMGNLLLAFVMFWTYVSFSQFLIMYAGNLPHEIEWYLHRIAGGWRWVILGIAFLHFMIPFLLLLFRSTKRRVRRLVTIAAVLIPVHWLYVFWMIAPSFHPDGLRVHWLDIVMPLAIGGFWLATFLSHLAKPSLMPRNDPRMETLPAHVT